MMRLRPLIVGVATALIGLVLLAAGCGGDDDSAEALSKEEFIAQADAICAEAFEQGEALGEEPSTSEPEQYETWYLEYQAIGEEALVELRALSPPAEDVETLDVMYSNYEAAYVSVPDRIAAALEGESGADLAIEQFHSAQLTAAGYGFGDCINFGLVGLA